MASLHDPWDYLILTASNESQAATYEAQLHLRRDLGMLADVRNVLAAPDPKEGRVGTGGSTILCLARVLEREVAARGDDPADWTACEKALENLRVLIIHASAKLFSIAR